MITENFFGNEPEKGIELLNSVFKGVTDPLNSVEKAHLFGALFPNQRYFIDLEYIDAVLQIAVKIASDGRPFGGNIVATVCRPE